MARLPENMERTLEDYRRMQERQLQAMVSEEHPDIERFRFERTAAFENLKNELTLMVKMVNNDGDGALPVATECQERIRRLLERDEELREHIGNYRERLQARLARMGHGKRALRGYGNSDLGASPRVMSKSG